MKLDWKQILVIAAVLIFIFQMLYYAIVGSPVSTGNGETPTPTITSGLASVDVVIEEYEPYLILMETSISEETINIISETEGVEEVRMAQGSYVVTLLKRENIEQVFSELRRMNLSPQVIAIIRFPPILEVEAPEETIGLVSQGISIQQTLDYILPLGELINASVGVRGQNGQLTELTSFTFESTIVEIEANVTIEEEIGAFTIYEVSWERRNEINTTALKETLNESEIEYAKRSYVELERNLTQQEIIDVQGLDYATYIGGNRIAILSNFSDKEKAQGDLPEEVVFPSSTLSIPGDASLDVGEATYRYKYRASIVALPTDYRWIGGYVEVESSEEKTAGEEITALIKAEAISNTLVDMVEASAVQP